VEQLSAASKSALVALRRSLGVLGRIPPARCPAVLVLVSVVVGALLVVVRHVCMQAQSSHM
jgi:hypothetical protein